MVAKRFRLLRRPRKAGVSALKIVAALLERRSTRLLQLRAKVAAFSRLEHPRLRGA